MVKIEYHWRPLSTKVLLVAVVNKSIGDWAAYIDAVPGQNHDEEYMEVAKHGSKVSEEMARMFFRIEERYRP
jgi:hypothetical protein